MARSSVTVHSIVLLYLHARIVLAKDANHVDDACCCKKQHGILV
ncbi:MAG: hypothetical protein WKG06_38995 [Segetibacter sp.]